MVNSFVDNFSFFDKYPYCKKYFKKWLNTSHFLFYTYNPPTIKSKQSPLTQLTFLNQIRLAGGVYAEIRQAHILQ